MKSLKAAALLLVALETRGGDLLIANAPTTNVTFVSGVFTGSSSGLAVLNVADLLDALKNGNVTVRAVSGGGNGDILITSDIAWSSPSSLRLEAYTHVALGAATITGAGSVQIRADSTGTGVGTMTASTGNVSVNGGSVDVFYNPATFGTPEQIYSGGKEPIAYMLVNSLENLQNIRANLAGDYALGRDIDASSSLFLNSGSGFRPIGEAGGLPFAFRGRFNGDNHTISNLSINRPGNFGVGLFGWVVGATISNVALKEAHVVGKSAVGVLVGMAEGLGNGFTSVSRTSASGVVFLSEHAGGGLIGMIENGSVVLSMSNASVNATGTEQLFIGGLIGYATAFAINHSLLIADCYASGSVNGGTASSVGGLIGQTDFARVINTYIAGAVTASGANVGGLIGNSNEGSIVNSFWDTQRSGQATSDGGIGKTTAEMVRKSTYTGWNFGPTWGIVEGQTYPFFPSLHAPARRRAITQPRT